MHPPNSKSSPSKCVCADSDVDAKKARERIRGLIVLSPDARRDVACVIIQAVKRRCVGGRRAGFDGDLDLKVHMVCRDAAHICVPSLVPTADSLPTRIAERIHVDPPMVPVSAAKAQTVRRRTGPTGLLGAVQIVIRGIDSAINSPVALSAGAEGRLWVWKVRDPVNHIGIGIAAPCWKAACHTQDNFAVHVVALGGSRVRGNDNGNAGNCCTDGTFHENLLRHPNFYLYEMINASVENQSQILRNAQDGGLLRKGASTQLGGTGFCNEHATAPL